MPEVTDSYCERCGSRYFFKPNAPKGLSLKGARVLAKGLKNFVLTDGQSMSDSIALARHEDDHEDSSRLTEAFHRTFNFCMTCRQYACDRCWNEKTGACLSCTPESGQDVATPRETMPQQREPMILGPEPMAQSPREPLVAQPAASDWEADWSLFTANASAEPVPSAALTGFNEPIKLPEPAAPKTQRPTATPEWPVADLPTASASSAGGSNGITGHRAARKQADIEAASLWPLADEIAPEMTLTPDEFDLVETRLGRGETAPEAAAPPAPEPPIAAAQAPEPEPELPVASSAPRLGDEPDFAGENFVLAEPAQPEQAAEWGASWRTATPSSWEMQPVSALDRGPASAPTYSTEPQEIEAAAGFEPMAPAEVPAAPQHLLSMPMPSLAEMSPTPKAKDHPPLITRLLGRKGPHRHSQTDNEAWPRVTKWSERPIKNTDWVERALAERAAQTNFAEQTVPEPESVTPDRPVAEPKPTPMPAFGYASATLPIQNVQETLDARSAAAMRLSAVGAANGPLAVPVNPAQPAAPARPEADRDVIEVATRRQGKMREPRNEPAPVAARSVVPDPGQPIPATPALPVSRPTAPAPWPPLGASWPAPQNPNAPWPVPKTAPIPAALAARAAPEPTLAEMWNQSSQEVLDRGSVRVCAHCALPVSTQARFCRRCGTRQT
jgi:hypothetical protein